MIALAVGPVSEAMRLPEQEWPATAERRLAHDMARAIARHPGGAVGGRTGISLVPAIRRRDGDIAQHVEKPKLVWLERADRRRVGKTVAAWHGDKVDLCETVLRRLVGDILVLAYLSGCRAPIKRRRGAGARRVFPFRLARQPVGFSGLPLEPGEIGGLDHRGVDADHRVAVGLRKSRVLPIELRIFCPLPLD